MTVDLGTARMLVAGAQSRAAELGKVVSVAVVDAGGFLVAVDRMDGARPLTPSIALAKAYTAAVMQRPSKMLAAWSESDPVFFSQVARMGLHPIVATPGGYPLKRDGVIIGAIGVSGGSPAEDQDICESVVSEAGFEMTFPEWGGAPAR
jgi:uncharacterized protein GlcG (DUF336 family)